MSVWFVSPAWRRFDVTRLALAQRARLCGELAERGIDAHGVVVADDENLELAREFGFDTIEQNNDLLGRRFNDGIEYALREGAEVVVVLGSDDWLHIDAFDRMPAATTPDPIVTEENPVAVWSPDAAEVVKGEGLMVVDLRAGVGQHCRCRTRGGAVPWLIHRRALEPSGGRPIRETQQRGIDFSLRLGLGDVNWITHDPHPLRGVDFKSATNLNAFEETAGALADGPLLDDPWAALAERYDDDLVALARSTHETMAVAA